MEHLNTILSLTAIIVSIVAILYSRYISKIEIRRRTREILAETISANTRFNNAFQAMRREREKTGLSLGDHEIEVFEKFQEIALQNEELNNLLKQIISMRRFRFTETDFSMMLLSKTTSNDLAAWIEIRFDRFKRHNDDINKELISVLSGRVGRA